MAATLDMVHLSRWKWVQQKSDKRITTTTAIVWSYADDYKVTFINSFRIHNFKSLTRDELRNISIFRWSFLPISIYGFVPALMDGSSDACLRPLLLNSIIEKNWLFWIRKSIFTINDFNIPTKNTVTVLTFSVVTIRSEHCGTQNSSFEIRIYGNEK